MQLSKLTSSLLNIRVYIAALLTSFHFFNISYLEIISLIYALYAFFDRKFSQKQIKCFNILKLGIFYVLGFTFTFSSLINSTEFLTLMKGSMALVLVPPLILFLIYIFDSTTDLLLVLLLSSIVPIVLGNKSIDTDTFQESFKFNFSSVFIYATLILGNLNVSGVKESHFKIFFMALFFSILGLYGNLRLLAFVAFVAAIYYLFSFSKFFRNRFVSLFSKPIYISFIVPIILLSMSISTSVVAIQLLNLSSFVSIINPDVISKSLAQVSGDFGIVFGGRSEVFASIPAWIQKPLFGWGAWAQDSNQFFRVQMIANLETFNYNFDFSKLMNNLSIKSNYIPTHSLLLNSLVWGGLMSFIPFYYWFANFISVFVRQSASTFVSYSITFVFFYLNWNILFSPFGYSHRSRFCFLLAIIFLSLFPKRRYSTRSI